MLSKDKRILIYDGSMFRRNYLEPYKISLIEGNDTSPVELINASNCFTYDIMVLVKKLENESRNEKPQQGKIHIVEQVSQDEMDYFSNIRGSIDSICSNFLANFRLQFQVTIFIQ